MVTSEHQKAAAIQSDTLTILLSNRIHAHLDDKRRAFKIAKTCKIVRDKTKDNILYGACRSVIKAVSSGQYTAAIKAIELTEINYFRDYR